MAVLVALLVLVGLALLPATEALLAVFAWLALLLALAEWIAGVGRDAPSLFGMALLALVLRAVRLRVAARLWERRPGPS